MDDKMKWYAIPSYTMKCRLYLNNTQKELIEKSLNGLRIVYNSTLYDMKKEGGCTKQKKSEDGTIVHFPDFKYAASAEHLNKLREENPMIGYAFKPKNTTAIAKNDFIKFFIIFSLIY